MTAVRVWLRRNLFRTPVDGVISILFGAVSLFVIWRLVRFVLVTGRWDIVRVNLRLLMIGRYPEAHVLRLAVTVVVIAAWAGLIAGIIRARQLRVARVGAYAKRLSFARVRDVVERFWLLGVVVLLLLALTSTPGPWITTGLAVVAAVLGRLVGPFVGRWRLGALGGAALVGALGAVPIVLFVYVADGAGVDAWGGFMLNMFLALCAIVLCYPIGVLMALGRRSKLPLVRLVSTAYIELVRGAPLFVLLLLANSALQFFVPADLAPSKPTRAIIVFTFFTGAYMAEIVRGGLQSVPRGQVEAAKALGLSPVRQTALVVLPQALRNVIPAQIGQLISLFKDTTLAGAAMSLFELLNVARTLTSQPEFRGQLLGPETLSFAALLLWTVSYTMSRESQRLEKRLGVGTR
ncbi:MAG TPA: amino acid ABC transporter permease [Ilumatobacteraceae bacterium]|nr:amino acid ABC transporter permease [Ilumatobacteraceae bacterium]